MVETHAHEGECSSLTLTARKNVVGIDRFESADKIDGPDYVAEGSAIVEILFRVEAAVHPVAVFELEDALVADTQTKLHYIGIR